MSFEIKPATVDQAPLILQFIEELAEYEKLRHEVVATEDDLRKTLFGDKPKAEVVFAYVEKEPIGYPSFFITTLRFLESLACT